MHRPKRFATSRKHQCLRNMAKRKNATPKTTCNIIFKMVLNGNLIKQKFTV